MGNITRDPDVKYTPRGICVVQIGIAINRKWKDDAGKAHEETTFVDCEFFGRMAEIISQYCHKGDPLYLEGRLRLDQWDDKQTGQKKSKMKVVGESFQLIGAKREDRKSEPQRPAERQNDTQQARPPQSRPQPPARPAAPPYDPNEPDDDSIPFE